MPAWAKEGRFLVWEAKVNLVFPRRLEVQVLFAVPAMCPWAITHLWTSVSTIVEPRGQIGWLHWALPPPTFCDLLCFDPEILSQQEGLWLSFSDSRDIGKEKKAEDRETDSLCLPEWDPALSGQISAGWGGGSGAGVVRDQPDAISLATELFWTKEK